MTRPARLDVAAVQALMKSLPGWALAADGKSISRRFKFADFDATMSYVNRLAAVANRHDHHPDLKVGYNYCEVLFQRQQRYPVRCHQHRLPDRLPRYATDHALPI